MATSKMMRLVAFGALAVMTCLLQRDGGEGRRVIAYIGAWPEANDPVYARFRQAVTRRHPELLSQAKFMHFHANTGNERMLSNALTMALAKRPAVLVTPTGESAVAAARLSSTTPFVFSSYTDPVAAGIRETLQLSRHANTGIALRSPVDGKRLELLKDAFPGIRNVAVLADNAWFSVGGGAYRLSEPAAALGLTLSFVTAESPQELDARMTTLEAAAYDAWYVPPSYLSYIAEREIIKHLRRLNAPAMHATGAEVRAGAVMAYEADTSFAMDALADLVARVYAGEPAGRIPVERPQRFRLAVSAQADGSPLQVDASVVRRADLVVRTP